MAALGLDVIARGNPLGLAELLKTKDRELAGIGETFDTG
jgi:hypothetical protein